MHRNNFGLQSKKPGCSCFDEIRNCVNVTDSIPIADPPVIEFINAVSVVVSRHSISHVKIYNKCFKALLKRPNLSFWIKYIRFTCNFSKHLSTLMCPIVLI